VSNHQVKTISPEVAYVKDPNISTFNPFEITSKNEVLSFLAESFCDGDF
jgi:hypothetical protein